MPQMIWHQIAKFKEKDWLKLWLSTTNPRYNDDERMVIIHYFFSVFWENVLKLQLVQTKSFFQKWLLWQLVVHKKQFDDSFWTTIWPARCEALMNVGFTKKPFAQYYLWQLWKYFFCLSNYKITAVLEDGHTTTTWKVKG